MRKKLPEIITREEAEALLAVPNARCATGLRNRVILEVMYRAGLRVSEVIKLRPGHIDWSLGQIKVKASKGGKDRVVPVDPETMDWLGRWEEKRPKSKGRFFTTLEAKPLSARYLGQLVARYAEKAGIQEVEKQEGKPRYKVHPHTLRHTYASEKLDEGFSLVEVQQLLGHSNIVTTSVYLHVNPTALREKIQSNRLRQRIQGQRIREQIAALQDQLAALEQGGLE